MFRVILSSRSIITGLVFFVLIVGGSLLYSWHVRRTSETELQRHDRFLRALQTQDKTRPAETVNAPTNTESPGFVSTPDESTDTPLSDETEAFPKETKSIDIEDAFLPEDMVSEEALAEDVPVSAHGFGPYPEVPADFPINVNWSTYETKLPVFELMIRVRIKLWEQGHNVTGISQENGVMHPIIRGTVYIEWSRDGKEVLGITGHPDDMSDAVVDQIESGNIPTWLTVLDYDTTGIDPYEFLDLQ